MGKFTDIDIVKERLFKMGYFLLVNIYNGISEKTDIIDFDGYKYRTVISALYDGKRPDKVHISNIHSIDNIKLWIEKNNKNFELISTSYDGLHGKLEINCFTHGTFYSNWAIMSRNGDCCQYCAKKKVHPQESVFSKRKDLVRYFKNEEDSKKILCGSDRYVNLNCPNCNTDKTMKMSQLSNSGLSCRVCSDNISIPEKFVIGILRHLYLEFKTQYAPIWGDKKRYDFYIPSLNIIIETHGAQHYSGWSKDRSLLYKQQSTDKYKRRLALLNGIDKYIEIDCRRSDCEFLKEQSIKSLSGIFDLHGVDLDAIYENCGNSLMILICNDWKDKEDEQTTKFLIEKYGLDRSTIVSYLKRGNKLNLCKYDKDFEIKKNHERKRYIIKKPVTQYDMDFNKIKTYESATEAGRILGIDMSSIRKCCNGTRKSVGGFIWEDAT